MQAAVQSVETVDVWLVLSGAHRERCDAELYDPSKFTPEYREKVLKAIAADKHDCLSSELDDIKDIDDPKWKAVEDDIEMNCKAAAIKFKYDEGIPRHCHIVKVISNKCW